MQLIKSFLKIFNRKIEQTSQESTSSASSSLKKDLVTHDFPVCTVYTKTLGPNFPLKVTEVIPGGVSVVSAHEIFQSGEYVVLKMVFTKMTVSVPGRVVKISTATSEAMHSYFIEFHRS
jgi:hypothetical protein